MKIRKEYKHLYIPDTADVTKGFDETNSLFEDLNIDSTDDKQQWAEPQNEVKLKEKADEKKKKWLWF